MNYCKAVKIIQMYELELAHGASSIAHDIRLLPADKQIIVLAYKVFMSFVAIFRPFKPDIVENHFSCLNKLNSFVSAEDAEYLNLIQQRATKKENLSVKEMNLWSDFFVSATMCDEHDVVLDVLMQVQKYTYDWLVTQNKDINNHSFFMRVYEDIIGIKYEPIFGEEFFDNGMLIANKSSEKSEE